jgi:hypothetical protein
LDHRYTRLASGLGFPASDDVQSCLRDVFSGGRSISVRKLNAETVVTARLLVKDGVVIEADGWFVPVGRFTWPVRGKYNPTRTVGWG